MVSGCHCVVRGSMSYDRLQHPLVGLLRFFCGTDGRGQFEPAPEARRCCTPPCLCGGLFHPSPVLSLKGLLCILFHNIFLFILTQKRIFKITLLGEKFPSLVPPVVLKALRLSPSSSVWEAWKCLPSVTFREHICNKSWNRKDNLPTYSPYPIISLYWKLHDSEGS